MNGTVSISSRRTSDPDESLSLYQTPKSHLKPRPSDSSDYSDITELSFEYLRNSKGELVRVSRSGKSSPPTPPQPSPVDHEFDSRAILSRSESAQPILSATKESLEPPLRSFQRVVSGPASTAGASTSTSLIRSARQLAFRTKILPTVNPDSRDNTRNRLVDIDRRDVNGISVDENDSLTEPEDVEYSKRPAASPRQAGRTASAPNIDLQSRITSALPSRAYTSSQYTGSRSIVPGPGRAGRVLKPNDQIPRSARPDLGRERAIEEEGGSRSSNEHVVAEGNENIPSQVNTGRHRTHASLASAPTALPLRTRRSNSLDGGPDSDDSPTSRRPGSSLGRLTAEGDNYSRQLQEQRAKPEVMSIRKMSEHILEIERLEAEEAEAEAEAAAAQMAHSVARANAILQQHRSTPPDARGSNHLPASSHRRRDSDTVRSTTNGPVSTSTSMTHYASSPTAVDPSNQRYAEGLSRSASGRQLHKRTPTAPQLSSPGDHLIQNQKSNRQQQHQAWVTDTETDEENERPAHKMPHQPQQDQHRQFQPPPPQSQYHHSQQQNNYQGLQPTSYLIQDQPSRKSANEVHAQTQGLVARPYSAPIPPRPPQSVSIPQLRTFTVNKRPYSRLDMIGKGGSSRVYRVMTEKHEIFAIKKVALDQTDAETMSGYMNEIALLKRLAGNHRIIRLVDSELRQGSGSSKGHLLLVMECGEIDLAKLLYEQQAAPMNMVWISYYWQQMLQAVHIIHEEKIIHSDLKPANFVLVRGQLKLIDFGIANAIANDTTNIQRDHQIGTVNYMSPEAIELPEGQRRLKVGRASDVWSLGCILYQMVYGQSPFYHLNMIQKMRAIPDASHSIDFPTRTAPVVKDSLTGECPAHMQVPVRQDVINTMQNCLQRNPKERATIPQLLDDDWLAMKEDASPKTVPAKLEADEAIINPHFMRQLLEYGIKLGRDDAHLQSLKAEPAGLDGEIARLIQELQSVQSVS